MDYLRSFPEVYRNATTFHREIATIPFVEEIFTTNWDDLFETECGALPVVTPEDFVLWEMPGRKVFKIHGSVTSLGSLVLTTQDYERSYQQLESGLIGSRLKLALATRTVLFCGYSLSDPDFVRLYHIVCREMGTAKPAIYVVTLDEPRVAEFRSMSLTPILTDASYFFEELKKRLVAERIMIGEQNLAEMYRLLQKVRDQHRKLHRSFQIHKHPETVFAASYQDGLAHACEHILSMATTGKYSHSCQIHASVKAYDEIRADKLKNRRYDDVAYIDGYRNGLAYLIAPPAMRKKLPFYYVFGAGEIRNLDEYAKVARQAKDLHKQAYRHAQRMVGQLSNAGRLIEFHHIAFL